MKRYSAYKDSGVEWIGEIPEDWEPKKLKYLAKVRLSNIDKKSNEGETSVRLCNYVDVYYNEKITSNIEFMEATAPKEKIDDFSLRRGDVLITKDSETPDDIAVPTYVPASLPGVVCGYHLALIRPNDGYADGNYLFRSFIAHGIRDQFEISANGITRFGIGKYAIEDSLFLCPPLEDQVKNSKYLDHKTRLIDTLIEKKQKQIELLKEQRTAIINQAVTKGLNPNVKMKDSGIEWLGEVPEHWKVSVRLTYITNYGKHSFVNGPFGSDLLTSELVDEGVPVIYIRDIKHGKYKRESNSFVTTEKAKQLNFCRVDPGDLLIAKVGDPPGISAIYPVFQSAGIVTQDVVRLKLNTQAVNQSYLSYLLNSHYGKSLIEQITIESTRSRFGLGDLKNSRVLLPPIGEQDRIALYLNEIIEKIDNSLFQLKRTIELASEYRTTLISNVVTGKIDVRDEVIP